MVQARCTFLEQGSNQHNIVGRGQFRIKSGRRAGNRFRQIKQLCIFRLTEVQGVVQFLQYHQLRPMGGTGFNALGQVHEVGPKVGRIGLLNNTDFYFSHHQNIYCFTT